MTRKWSGNKKLHEQVSSVKGEVCWACGLVREGLEVHHIKARVDGGTDELTNLSLLCRMCHMFVPSGNAEEFKSYCKRGGTVFPLMMGTNMLHAVSVMKKYDEKYFQQFYDFIKNSGKKLK